jgi:hypothetical protein
MRRVSLAGKKKNEKILPDRPLLKGGEKFFPL